MREIVTLEQWDRVMLVVALAGVPLGALAGLALAAARRECRALGQSLALGLLGPLAGLAWLFFRWTVRLDPQTHFVGLYRPGVLAADVALFMAAGAGLGLLYRAVFAKKKEEDEDGDGNDAAV